MADPRLKEISENEVKELHEKYSQEGFDVSYEEKIGGVLHSCYLDVKIDNEDAAWEIADAIAKGAKGRYVNLYVIYRNAEGTTMPVFNYQDRYIENR